MHAAIREFIYLFFIYLFIIFVKPHKFEYNTISNYINILVTYVIVKGFVSCLNQQY